MPAGSRSACKNGRPNASGRPSWQFSAGDSFASDGEQFAVLTSEPAFKKAIDAVFSAFGAGLI
jgi:hypothetical protein